MGDSYDRVQQNAVAQSRYEQALSILQVEAMLPTSLLADPRFFPRYLQVLRPRSKDKASGAAAAIDTDNNMESWSGRLNQICKMIELSERRVAKDINKVNRKLAQMEVGMGLPPSMAVGEDEGEEDGLGEEEEEGEGEAEGEGEEEEEEDIRRRRGGGEGEGDHVANMEMRMAAAQKGGRVSPSHRSSPPPPSPSPLDGGEKVMLVERMARLEAKMDALLIALGGAGAAQKEM
jgi:hypothetical protein